MELLSYCPAAQDNRSVPTPCEQALGSDCPTRPISGRTELWKTPPGRKRAQEAHRVRARGCDWGEMPRRATQRHSPELEESRGSQRCPARLPAPVPGVGLGQRAAAQAGAPPGGAQSPALTQLKAGAAALPCPRRLRWHSPAEVIMAAPCTRSPARSRFQPRSVSVSSGPLAPPRLFTARVPSSVSRLFRPPAHFSPRTPPVQGLPSAPPAARREFSPGLRLPRHTVPRGRVRRELHCFL